MSDRAYLESLSNSATVRLICGVCGSSLVTEAWSGERKDKVIADFNEAHRVCRESASGSAAKENT